MAAGRILWVDKRPDLPTRDELPLVTLAEAKKLGLTSRVLRWRVDHGRWQRPHRSVYVTHNGPIDWATSAGAALLAAGPGAALEAWSAAYVLGLAEEPEGEHALLLPTARRITAPAGTRVRYADRPKRLLGLWPPRTTLEWTVNQITKDGSPDDALAVIGAVLQRRRTTPARLQQVLVAERRHPHRALLRDALTDAAGLESVLEFRWVRDVERPHGIPPGHRQLRQTVRNCGRRYDIGYGVPPGLPDATDLLAAAACAVELDGLLLHRGKGRVDRAKQNAATTRGTPLLRYGWQETAETPCETAAEIIGLATSLGLTWPTRPCRRADCAVR
ncbi:MAG: type IV toxin-antitoxin system AbiEi family antitoxin domain-containing protein [Tetrasphaera sp.]